MRAEDGHGAIGNFVQPLDEARALLLERLHDMLIVDDLMANEDGLAEFLQRALDNIDGADNAGAETAWLGKQNAHYCVATRSLDIGLMLQTFRQNLR